MANFECKTISNIFKVKDVSSFLKEFKKLGCEDFLTISPDGVSLALYGDLFAYNEKNDEDVTHDDFCAIIQRHMEDNEKVFISTVGSEKFRYLAADCTIITKDDIVLYDLFNMISREYNNEKSVF